MGTGERARERPVRTLEKQCPLVQESDSLNAIKANILFESEIIQFDSSLGSFAAGDVRNGMMSTQEWGKQRTSSKLNLET